MDLISLIAELCSISAPSGFESPVAERISELAAPFCDEVKSDALGNVIAIKKSGKPGAKRLMLCAHMDEIGLIVTGHEKGFLRFASIGGVDCRMLPACEVRVLTKKPIFGVIDTIPPHVLNSSEMEKSIDISKLFIDIGLDEEAAKERVALGTPIVFNSSLQLLGEDRLCGKALDDRSCVAIILKALELLSIQTLDVDLYVLFSVQEEVGLRGSRTGTFSIEPDIAVVLDVTHAYTPDAKHEQTMELGKGAAIGVGPNMQRSYSQKLQKLATEKNIPYQIEVISGSSGTDGWEIQISREGVATALVSLPVKYMHTPVETMSMADAEAVLRLVCEFCKEVD